MKHLSDSLSDDTRRLWNIDCLSKVDSATCHSKRFRFHFRLTKFLTKREDIPMKHHLRMTLPLLLLTIAFCLALSGVALAQEETAASVSGQVTDATGAIVAGATVVVTNDANGQERRVQTNDEGRFVISPLSPGTYTVTVEQTNFKKHV